MLDVTQIDDLLTQSEADVPGLRPGAEKRVIWADQPGTKKPLTLLYIHGFSATAEELRPLPDIVAKGIGANLHFTRLTGHGQGGPALAAATLADWQRDVAEALKTAETIGEQVIIMGCSTGCTLASLALSEGAQAGAMIHISPNFGLANRAGQVLLDLPGVRRWGRFIAGKEREFTPINAGHAANWTIRYPIEAVYTMADAVRAARHCDLSDVQTAALFAFNVKDQVVSAKEIDKVMARWGGPTKALHLVQGPNDDASGHVMAGDVFSPDQTAPLAKEILKWLHQILGTAP